MNTLDKIVLWLVRIAGFCIIAGVSIGVIVAIVYTFLKLQS